MSARYLAALLGSASLLTFATASPVSAQAQQAPAGSSEELQEIVVTAQRREQKLQSVPISITALSAETL
ncbi:MAG TPA: hypothetical protein VKZ79_04990, partial [Alphaproteobacteria bacterium]|nr:hypothetical protein [Alphaproteobacteria bacterium]